MSMLKFIFYLGIINIVFGFVWKWVFVIPGALIMTLLKFNNGMHIIKILGSYLLVSLTALLTLYAIHDSDSIFLLIVYPLIGTFVLYMGYASNYYEAKKQIAINYDYESADLLRHESFYMIGGILLYVITLFVPTLAVNFLTEWLFSVIDWAYQLPVIGWLLGLGGVVMIIGTVWHGFLVSGLLLSSVMGKFRKENNHDSN